MKTAFRSLAAFLLAIMALGMFHSVDAQSAPSRPVSAVILWDETNNNERGSATNPIVTTGSGTGGSIGVAQGSTTAGQSGTLDQGAVVTAPPTYTTGQTSPLSLQPIGGGLRTVPSVPDGNVTGTPPPADMMGVWNITTGGSNALRAIDLGTIWVHAAGIPYPVNPVLSSLSTPFTATSGNVANASAVATMTATASVTNYVSGFECTGSGATAAAVVTTVLSGTINGSLSYTEVAPAGATVAMTPLIVTFNPPIPASAANTAISITRSALGAGNTNSVCNIHGYKY